MLRLATAGLVLLLCALPTFGQIVGGTGPDVIVGDVFEIQPWGTFNNISAFSIGTESCNIGTSNLIWIQNTNQHPVISQNMYRLKDGRFEQIGMSWLKHGFYALSNSNCQTCGNNGSPDGSYLGVHCSDPYTASLNGAQGNLGPLNEVNPVTGYFPYPPGNYPAPQPTIGQRLQVLNTDLAPASNIGAIYFVQGHYVHPTDAAAGNKDNNASYRKIDVIPSGSGYNAQVVDTTQRMKPAIQAWQDNDPTVQIKIVDIPGDGRILVGYKATPLTGNTFHYEYAVQNLNSFRSIGSISVEIWPGANVTNIGWHGVPHHSGEPYSTASWTSQLTPGTQWPGQLKWSCPTYATDQNANALRWGSLYNVRFDSDQLPGNMTLGIFAPGSPTTIAVPAFCAPKRPPPTPQPPYTINSTTAYDYVNLVSLTSGYGFGPVGDDAASTVTLPFAFPFYGGTYNQIVISTNGYLTLPGQTGTVSSNTTLPSAGLPNGMIAGYWDDLICPNVGDIRYKTVNGRFVVSWNGFHLGSASPLLFEVILESSGAIVSTIVTCPTNPGGNSATRGIENPTGTAGLLYSFNTPNSALNQTTIRYEPNNAVPLTANLFTSGSLGGGMFQVVYVSAPNDPILTMVSFGAGPFNLGALGSIPIDINSVMPISDYYGVLGPPNSTAVTDATCGQHVYQIWIPVGYIVPGILFGFAGVDWPLNPQTAPNGVFNIANGVIRTSP